MTTQRTTSHKLLTMLTIALAGLALVVLFLKLDEPLGQLTNILCAAGWATLDLVPHFVAAAADSFVANVFNHLWSFSCPLHILASLSPLHILTALA
jgi:hypothetical protein